MKGPGLVLLLLAASAAAQPEPAAEDDAPALAVLLYHPYPDAADPLGFAFPAGAARDAFAARYGFLVQGQGSFPYPYAVVDGIHPVAGLPDPDRPYTSALEAYEDAVATRQARAPAVAMEVQAAATGDTARLQVRVEPAGPVAGASLRLWAALAEDHVAYRPPAALSNGVFDHRFTVRALADLGPIDLSAGSPAEGAADWGLQPSWSRDRLFAVAWLQQGAVDGRFAAHEVVQSVLHPLSHAQPTRQEAPGVLLEMLSATWCDTCLYGDAAAADLAARHGVPDLAPAPRPARYLRAPAEPWLAAAAAAAGAALALAASRRPS